MYTSRYGRVAVVAVLIVAVLAACSGGGGMPMETEPAPPPSLVGVWSNEDSWTSSTGVAFKSEALLTFTGEGRAIVAWLTYESGEPRYTGADSHSWNVGTPGTVVKTGVYDHDYNGETPEVSLPPVHKSYYFVDDDTLLVHAWGDDRAFSLFEEFTRVAEPALPVGEWRSRDGSWEVTVGADGSFNATDHGRDDGAYWSISGTGTLNLAGYYIELTGLTSGRDDREPRQWADGTGRVAFAPAPTGIVLSMPWDEQEGNQYYRENGRYWLLLEPKQ